MHRKPHLRLSLCVLLLAAASVGLGSVGCADDPLPRSEAAPPPLQGAIVPIYREVGSDELERRRSALGQEGDIACVRCAPSANQDFYLAIRKSELDQKWFLSAFLNQLAPNGVDSGAAVSLGTRVVSFQVQNRKLFVFDVADDKIWSDRFRPEVLLEAYPIINGFAAFDRLPGASEYVLFDPAAGLNRFRFLQETSTPLDVELSFSQRFRAIADGVTFEQVFSGSLRRLNAIPGTPNLSAPPRVTGTLSLALRRYSEGEGYVPTPMPMREHYFRSPSKLVPNEGVRTFTAAKWNVQADGPRILWKIAPDLPARLQEDPRFADIDFAGAIAAGIESWNAAFAAPMIEARLADPAESHGDDDVNYFIFDANRSIGGAFANFRMNPNNGEIRGASVYFAFGVLDAIGELPETAWSGQSPAEAEESSVLLAPQPARKVADPGLAWGEVSQESLCDLVLPTWEEVLTAEPPASPPFTRKQKIERFLSHIAAHEIGHTLGLRHNFKGSLEPPSSSVMEYVLPEDSILMGSSIGSYDVAAIRHLYGLSPNLPQDPFCTDGDADVVDPDCRRRDFGREPLIEHFIPNYLRSLAVFMAARSDSIFSPGQLVAHVRLPLNPGVRLAAYQGIMAPLREPIVPPADAPPSFGGRLNAVTQLALRQTFLDQLPGAIPVPGVPLPPVRPPAEPVLGVAIADLKGLILNGSGLRTAASRRQAVDLLKFFQSPAAYAALAEARAVVAAQLPALEGVAAVTTMDLLNRIDRILGAYFD
jgi:hypothetical protein